MYLNAVERGVQGRGEEGGPSSGQAGGVQRRHARFRQRCKALGKYLAVKIIYLFEKEGETDRQTEIIPASKSA